MSILAKILADGQLPSTQGVLYTVPANTRTYVKFFSLSNVGASVEAITIFVRPGATARQVANASLNPGETFLVIEKDDTMTLHMGTIEGVATDPTSVDYFISGAEET